ncbi:MAG: DUF2183 domain-containing protein [Nitrosopumilus sp.]|nr:DUF2183 domain-containing protein [Nitrosopumilus sp.]MBA3551117.1 DUF2183 domain-containing protein [Patescibacteria group bacterium]
MIFKKLLGIYPTPHLHVYRSFSNTTSVHIIGRVSEKIKKSHSSSMLSNALTLIRAYIAKPYINFEVTILSGGNTKKVTTNKNGIFEVTYPFSQKIEIMCGDDVVPADIGISISQAAFGIISDIDDTILISHVGRTVKLLYLLFTKNAHSRKPFPGVAEFYQALVHTNNPIFYVSSSAWNLYDMLIEFMEINSIPRGPLLLKEIAGITSLYAGMGKHTHKLKRIEILLAFYPKLPFILLGDSGQKDAEIYTSIVKKYPDRIKVIYIRDISVKKDSIVKDTIQTINENVEIVYAKTSQEAAAHALKHGFIVKREETLVKEGIAQEF